MSASGTITLKKVMEFPAVSRLRMGTANILSEAELIAGCAVNDRRCQQQVFERFYGRMMGVCLRYAQDRDEAKDILQEGFMKVFEKIGSFSHEGSFEGWMRRIMTHTAIDHFRKNRKNMELFENNIRGEALENLGEEPEEESTLINRFRPEEVLKAVQQLSPAYRTVFNLYVMEEFTHKEIAGKLGISEGTSKSNLAKAKMKLKAILTESITIHK